MISNIHGQPFTIQECQNMLQHWNFLRLGAVFGGRCVLVIREPMLFPDDKTRVGSYNVGLLTNQQTDMAASPEKSDWIHSPWKFQNMSVTMIISDDVIKRDVEMQSTVLPVVCGHFIGMCTKVRIKVSPKHVKIGANYPPQKKTKNKTKTN